MKRTTQSDGSEQQTLSDRLGSWRDLLDGCGRKPTRKRVHALRVATLRLQAEVEDQLRDLPCASREAQAMLRFGKLADKLRDALGAVRELDVWIGKLEKLRESLSESTEYVPRSTRETIRQIDRLEGWLEKKRKRVGAKLSANIEKRLNDLTAASRDVDQAAGEPSGEADGEQGARLLKEFARIAAEFPAFNEENLHGFRKRIKKIRYLAEIHQANPICERIAVQVKKAQAAIGEWHDWQVLARTAERRKHAKDAEVGELLSSMAIDTFHAAVATCEGVLRRMAEMERDGAAGLGIPRKGPVRDEAGIGVPAGKLA